MFDKSVEIDIPCENCGHETSLSIEELESNPSYQCPSCQAEINIDASKLMNTLDGLEDTIRKSVKSIKF